ncbi:TPA: arginine ABC transporter ATP-binding protein ArtP [Haemophilus influenzae]|uniref:arginine ABC transporter ATP-binding protein ArtP n=1 Tax=Haemophilus influenzae TaxID=727 RepID=UPI000666F87E|nr:arginine ABC transporter ATP-binding protein ArtP [Haemophilus influenzae]AXP56817.1 arginine ABC transporter ATP-binding protein ArtP [Haemophilus influenzae]MBZ5690264.1 arginine ABC transporter ATP-binding protein ArtP [Haemophilus influenzae]MCK8913178.1 arginine ABC transporter ATP-binding protein ArtP [Haemophilus influenzae]MCK9642221.1 arginine ABC transporter ATP-binding protein ArtP [Haemophilus influenzae]RFN69553.1 arginine ABC transporter ATP-binding protein ArtP [Haemophilus i
MAIRVKNLNFFYGSSQTLFDINLEAEEGDTVVLLGPSGAGKSTLIRTLNLLEVPKSGELSIANNEFNLSNAMANPKAIRQLRQDVGMVFQQYHLWPHLTVIENLIEAPMKVRGVSENEAKTDAMELLKRLRLEQLADRFPLHLSGGQQQRVAIARALMMKPQVLLFDEPTAALDPEITAQVVDIIKELQETSITQVIVTHEVNVAQKVATKVVYMEQGKIVEMGSADCFENPKTEQFKHYLSH